MRNLFLILQIVFAVGLAGLVILQSKSSGLGNLFGGQTNYHSKRGVEKVVSLTTVALAVLFLASSLLNAFLF